jgi:hypothetical protein
MRIFGAADALQRPTILLRRRNAVYFSDPKGSFGKESFGRVKSSRLSRTCRLRANRVAEYSIPRSEDDVLNKLVKTY